MVRSAGVISNCISFSASAKVVSETGGSQTPSPVDISTTDGAAGQLSLTIDVPAGGDPLVAGVYSDSVVIELQVAS